MASGGGRDDGSDGSDGLAATVRADDAAFDETASLAWHGPAPAPRDDLRTGSRVGRYLLEDELGAGGMGVVYRARDPELGRVLAVKLVKPRFAGTQGRARLLREAQAMARLHHPNVVPVFDVGTVGDQVFVVMPFLAGGTLGQWMHARPSPRPWREVLDRFVAAARGLVAAHDADLVHRDFKPANVLIGGSGEVQVADFGMARLGQDATPRSTTTDRDDEPAIDLTRTGDVMGTPAYMAPEQMRGEVSDARGDQFSFCVALWEALYGARPFDAGDAHGAAALTVLLAAITEGRITAAPASSGVPAWLRAIVSRGLRAAPAERWPSMQALLAEIERHRAPRRRRWPIALTAGIAVAAITSLVVVATRDAEPPAGSAAPAPPLPARRIHRLTQRGDVSVAVISPDGATLAMIAGGSLVVRGSADDATERVLVSGVVSQGALSWSPDGRQLLVTRTSPGPDEATLALIDVATGRVTTTTLSGFASHASNTELAVLDLATRTVEFFAIAETSTPVASCPLPGDVDVVNGIALAHATGDLVMLTQNRRRKNVVLVIGRDCQQRGVVQLADPVDAFAITSTGDSVMIATKDRGMTRVTKYGLDGRRLEPGRTLGVEAMDVVGEVGRRTYLVTLDIATTLERDHGGTVETVAEVRAHAYFSVAPDGNRVAWIEGTTPRTGDLIPGPLRIARLDDIDRRGPVLVPDARAASWSPDGTSIAVVAERDDRFVLLTVEVATGKTTTFAIDDLYESEAPIWLDQHRVAVHTASLTGLQWVDVRTGDVWRIQPPGTGTFHSASRSPRDGRFAFVFAAGLERSVWILGDDEVPRQTPIQVLPDESLQWTSAGELIVLSVPRGTVDRADPVTGRREQVRTFSTSDAVGGVSLLPDSDLLIATFGPRTDVVVVEPR